MYTYKYEFVDGHIIAIVAQSRLLIDTGSPSSIGDDSSLLGFAGDYYSLKKSLMGVSSEYLSQQIGTPISALVGTDILNQRQLPRHLWLGLVG